MFINNQKNREVVMDITSDMKNRVEDALKDDEGMKDVFYWFVKQEISGLPRGKDANTHLLKGGTVLVHDKDGGVYELNNKMLAAGAKLYLQNCKDKKTKKALKGGFSALTSELLNVVMQYALYKEIRYPMI